MPDLSDVEAAVRAVLGRIDAAWKLKTFEWGTNQLGSPEGLESYEYVVVADLDEHMMMAIDNPINACPPMYRNPYIVENQCGSRDMPQSIEANVIVNA